MGVRRRLSTEEEKNSGEEYYLWFTFYKGKKKWGQIESI